MNMHHGTKLERMYKHLTNKLKTRTKHYNGFCLLPSEKESRKGMRLHLGFVICVNNFIEESIDKMQSTRETYNAIYVRLDILL